MWQKRRTTRQTDGRNKKGILTRKIRVRLCRKGGRQILLHVTIPASISNNPRPLAESQLQNPIEQTTNSGGQVVMDWWKCCQCYREINCSTFADFCPDCNHARCKDCEDISAPPPPRPRHAFDSFCTASECPSNTRYGCNCEAGSCNCGPPRPPPRPTSQFGDFGS